MPTAAVTASLPPPKRLLFDRRYGWILDEWKEPSVEALSGGRGMFCVIPLAKALIQKASETPFPNFDLADCLLKTLSSLGFISLSSLVTSLLRLLLCVSGETVKLFMQLVLLGLDDGVNFVGSSTLEVLDKPELLSPKALQATLTHQMQRFKSSVNDAKLVPMAPARSKETGSTPILTDQPK
ncbi:hypothetical protein SASPL_150354 [Salvia splendens]|uniref:Uncharacterized protein n=1 Tax=Salvia splendens TaxID=180675 RepID=A0A8X8Z2E2_SALSN|nr:hypothetical protein SASPL_150354 [Salvia splendens]